MRNVPIPGRRRHIPADTTHGLPSPAQHRIVETAGSFNATLRCSCFTFAKPASRTPPESCRTTFRRRRESQGKHFRRTYGAAPGHNNRRHHRLVAIFAVVGFLFARKRRSKMLRERFGPEYDRVVRKEGDVHRGEEVLQFRATRREKLQIVPLSPAVRSDFVNRWTTVQSLFVDDPKGAVSQGTSS